MLLWSERWWVVVVVGTAAAERALPPPPHPGEKGERGSSPHLLSLCVPSAFSPPVCSSLPRPPPSPSAAKKGWRRKSDRRSGKEMNEQSGRPAGTFCRTGLPMSLTQVV